MSYHSRKFQVMYGLSLERVMRARNLVRNLEGNEGTDWTEIELAAAGGPAHERAERIVQIGRKLT